MLVGLSNMFEMKPVDKSCDKKYFLLKIRLFMSGISTLHLVFLACALLPIDFSTIDEPKLKLYGRVKYKLFTSWVNLIMLSYYPVSFYCDWRELRGEAGCKHIRILNKVRHACFSNVLFPATMVADTLFWRLWLKDRELICPIELDNYIPSWTYHCLHTVSLVVLILDLVVVPRKKPRSMRPGMMMMFTFVTMYHIMCTVTHLQGDNIYPMFGIMTVSRLALFAMLVYTEHLLYFTVQWLVIDFLWGNWERKNKVL